MNRQGWRHREVALSIVVALGLSACGGSGSNIRPVSITPPPPPPAQPPAPAPPPATPEEDPPMDAQLALTHAYAAHDQGFSGSGVTIGIVDSGIMRFHPSVVGRVADELLYVDPDVNNTAIDDVVGHGTWVSEIAAGKAYDEFPGGIAPGATLISARIIADEEPVDDGSGQGNAVGASDADFFGQSLNPDLIAAGVRVQNNSWGGIYWDTTDTTINQAFGAAYHDFVIGHDGLVVFAAGNESRAEPSDIAALPGLVPELERGWLVAVAANSNHPSQLADYSNACGTAMDYCLTAPGDVIVGDKDATSSNPNGYWVVSGTSFAAPAVSGAAALVWQAYPYFDNDLVRQTLLGTADDLGAPGVDATFGHGMLDVGRAVNGPAKFDWGDVTVDFTGGSVWNNPISGAGGLIKQGGGMLILTQPATYTGLTHVMEGTLVAKALAGSLDMDPNSVVRDTRAIAGSVANDGTLMVSGGDVTVGGNYAQGASGRLALELGSALRVTGAAALSGAGNGYAGADLQVIGAASGYVANTHTDVLVAQGGLTGTFTTLSLDAGVLLDATLDYDATSAWLDVVQVQASAVPDVTYSAASYAAAQRVDGAFGQINAQLGSAPGSTGAGFLTGASSLQRTPTPSALEQSLASLSGQLHAASAALTFEAIDAGTRALSDRFDRLLGSDAPGSWTQGLGYHGGMARAGYADVAVDLSGTLAGQDMRVGSNGVLGFALGQARGLGRLAESADQGRSHAVEGMLYGGLVHGNAYLMGRVGLGNDHQLSRRNLQLGGTFAGVGSASHGRYSVGYGESGYRATLGQLALTPYASLQYARIDSSGFNEPGAYGFGLKAGARTVERWQAGLGLRAARRWDFAGGGKLDLQAHLAWQRAFAVRGDVFQASFTGLEQWAPLGGIGLSRYGGVAGVALDWTMSPHAGMSFGIDHRFAQREQGSMATLAYRLSF